MGGKTAYFYTLSLQIRFSEQSKIVKKKLKPTFKTFGILLFKTIE